MAHGVRACPLPSPSLSGLRGDFRGSQRKSFIPALLSLPSLSLGANPSAGLRHPSFLPSRSPMQLQTEALKACIPVPRAGLRGRVAETSPQSSLLYDTRATTPCTLPPSPSPSTVVT